MLALMLDPQYEGLGMVIQYGGKQITFQITSAYDREYCSHFSFVHTKILNSTNANENGPCSFASHNSQFTNLYDVMENDDDMCHKHENNQIYMIL